MRLGAAWACVCERREHFSEQKLGWLWTVTAGRIFTSALSLLFSQTLGACGPQCPSGYTQPQDITMACCPP